MQEVFKKYNITPDMPDTEKLEVLENAKRRLLLKLNHVFGDSDKEQIISAEMDRLESVMENLQQSEMLSMDDVEIETRGLKQTSLKPGEKKKLDIEEKERKLLAGGLTLKEEKIWSLEVLVYYLEKKQFDKIEQWGLFNARKGVTTGMVMMYLFHTREVYGAQDEQKALFWLRKAAELGDKYACLELGKLYLDKNREMYDPKSAAFLLVKAADTDENKEAYLLAFQAFLLMEDYKKARICLKGAIDLGIPEALENRDLLDKLAAM